MTFIAWKVGRLIGVYISEKEYETKEEAEEVYQRLLENYERAEASGINSHPLMRVSKPWMIEEGDTEDTRSGIGKLPTYLRPFYKAMLR